MYVPIVYGFLPELNVFVFVISSRIYFIMQHCNGVYLLYLLIWVTLVNTVM